MAKQRSSSRDSKTGGKRSKSGVGGDQEVFNWDGGGDNVEAITLRGAAQSRYLNYSLSVITSRALPDVRDGLKPVQRRILYTMEQQNLTFTTKPRKCAKIVGEVMGNYHPHGDSSIYEALVRMAQPFSLRMPLVDGSGNFGSIDGDNAAAMRYTECRLSAIASEVLMDLKTVTVHFKPNYDGTRQEPVVLPSRLPNLLLNGTTGIAVGMATNIPPHNLGEICRALLKLLKDPEIKDYQLVANDAIQGPDFPTGGQVINTKEELREIYRTGHGSLKIRGTTVSGPEAKSHKVLQITSIPYGVNKTLLVERIGEIIFSGKMPLIQEVRDLSTDDIRIDLMLKKDADEAKVLAYLYKNTALQTNFGVNMTCLVPTENPALGAPERLGLKEILWHFLHFRLEVVTKRLENELAALERRLHILEGFLVVFDALDEIIRIIRKSEGKADAAKKIMARFPADQGGLDAEQTDAILELKLYRLARLEINLIREEVDEKRKRARAIRKLLQEDTKDTNASGRWGIVREEIEGLLQTYASSTEAKRRTQMLTVVDEPEFTADDFIVAEDCAILITTDGWVKRQKQITDPSKSRLREGDRVLACVAGSTRSVVAFFSSLGVCYSARMVDVPPSTGYGEPIQKLFKLKDGERIIACMSMDERVVGDIQENAKRPDLCPAVHAIAATTNGYAMRFGLATFAEPSTRSGRRYCRVATGSEVNNVYAIDGSETLLAVTAHCRAMVCPIAEINYLSGPGKGVTLIKVAKGDTVLGFKPSKGDRDLMVVVTNRGAKKTISTGKYRVTSRGGRGIEIQKNGKIAHVLQLEPGAPAVLEDSDD